MSGDATGPPCRRNEANPPAACIILAPDLVILAPDLVILAPDLVIPAPDLVILAPDLVIPAKAGTHLLPTRPVRDGYAQTAGPSFPHPHRHSRESGDPSASDQLR